ncbi:Vacuolar assembly/sorting protein PEP5/VPS11 [Phaffia rhodozyma]|uniref:E3 ubiquitin-protein ligase PEP5 n=1 Tax=Phaffia rhodozyma TaxID=264483 RepID=A0A0F7SH19_PHARH|nr:Vacuolar assembly/sorting protein PEP5/VPS11 [Phaffia rhodozyma]
MPKQPASAPSAPAWRSFSFFESSVANLESTAADVLQIPQSISVITPCSVSKHPILLADSEGNISTLSATFSPVLSWLAFPEGRCTHLLEARGIVVGLGEERLSPYPILKIWDLLHVDKKTQRPMLLKNIKIQHGGRPHPVSAAALTTNLSHLAVGLGDGTVLLYRHLSQSLASSISSTSATISIVPSSTSASSSLISLPKPKVLLDNTNEPITGLLFREEPARPASATSRSLVPGDVYIFVVTTNKTMVGQAEGKSKKLGGSITGMTVGELRVLDDVGGNLGCTTGVVVADSDAEGGGGGGEGSGLSQTETNVNSKQTTGSGSSTALNLAVAREEAIHLYSPSGRLSSFAYEGPKSSISTFPTIPTGRSVPNSSHTSSSLVIVSPPFVPSSTSTSQTVRNLVRAQPGLVQHGTDISRLAVLDLEGKFISYSGAFNQGVKQVFCLNDVIWVLGNDGKLTKLAPLPLTEWLTHFFSKHLFVLALTLARSNNLGRPVIADIHRRYGDHLYAKSDFEGSVDQYIKTLGELQPSYVIRKFLDAQRITHLTTYLQELHAANLANSDHTTLLLNCFTKTGDLPRLESFLRTSSFPTSTNSDTKELPFDLDTAIRVCRQAGFYDHAIFLAKRWKKHDQYFDIMIEDTQQWGAALAYLKDLEPEQAQENLVRYGKTLLNQSPKETTDLFIHLCTQPSAPSPRPYLVHFIGHPDELVRFLEAVASSRYGFSAESPVKNTSNSTKPAPSQPPAYDVELSMAASSEKDPADQRAVWSTLLELYLLFWKKQSLSSLQREVYRAKAFSLVEKAGDEHAYDITAALILCSTSDFSEGMVLLWEKLGMYEDVLRFWMEKENEREVDGSNGLVSPSPSSQRRPSDEVLTQLRIYGPMNHHLYPLVLRFLTSSNALLARHQADVAEVLEIIDEERIMPTLEIVKVFGRNEVASVGIVKDWLKAKVQGMRLEVDSDRVLMNSYRTETSAKLKEVEALTDDTQPQVFQVTRCASCGLNLDLPTIHYMCRHSYHQRCLPEVHPDCPLCASQHGLIREITANHARNRDNHELFLSEVQESTHGFGVVAHGFGRGVIGGSSATS